ncbi:MAG: CsgG/HfaB family protein [Nannocystales bacterium]
MLFTFTPRHGALALILSLGTVGPGCNMFANMTAKVRGTANAVGKRNVTFQRPVPAEKELEGIERIALVELQGDEAAAELLRSRLASLVSDGQRFELIEAASKQEAKESGAEALAVVGGKIVRAEYGEQTDSQKATCNGDPCTITVRTGTANVAVDFKVIDVRSGKVLLRKTLEDTVEEKTSGQGTPPAIDGSALQDQLLASVAESFHAQISPHGVSEQVFFESDNKAKALKTGANRAMSGDLEGAIASFEEGLQQAKAKSDTKAIAKAQFNLGIALVIAGDYDKGIERLETAQAGADKTAWRELLLASRKWQEDAEAAHEQWESGPVDAFAFSPDLKPAEDKLGGTALGLAGVKVTK